MKPAEGWISRVLDGRQCEPAPVHIDLYTNERDRHIKRLVELGAAVADDWDYPDEHDFVVLRDPDGNEFCVIQVEP